MSQRMVPIPLTPVERTVRERALEPLAFWVSVLLPVAYVPLLFDGFGDGQLQTFLGLVALHVVCLVVGHGYRR